MLKKLSLLFFYTSSLLSVVEHKPIVYETLKVKSTQEKADLIVFSYDRPLQLYAYLESLKKLATNINQTFVLYKSSSDEYDAAFDEVRTSFPAVQFFKQTRHQSDDFKPLLLKLCFELSTTKYVVFGVDDIIMTEPVDIKKCVQALEKTKSYGFYLRLGKNIDTLYGLTTNEQLQLPVFTELGDHVLQWSFTPHDWSNPWSYPHSVDMVIFNKQDIKMPLDVLPYKTPNDLEFHWSRSIPVAADKKALCMSKSVMVNIPLNVVNQQSCERHMHFASTNEMLQFFCAGLKIDTSKFLHLNNKTVHEEHVPKFVLR